MTTASLPSADLVRWLFTYDADTGMFFHRNPLRKSLAGQPAGSVNAHRNYRLVSVGRQNYKAHRVAWLYIHGVWPSGEIDHLNGDRMDNRLCNLRDVPHAINMQNLRSARQDNRSGLLGVRLSGDKFMAVIKLRGTPIYLGTYETAAQAHQAYRLAKRTYHPGAPAELKEPT